MDLRYLKESKHFSQNPSSAAQGFSVKDGAELRLPQARPILSRQAYPGTTGGLAILQPF